RFSRAVAACDHHQRSLGDLETHLQEGPATPVAPADSGGSDGHGRRTLFEVVVRVLGELRAQGIRPRGIGCQSAQLHPCWWQTLQGGEDVLPVFGGWLPFHADVYAEPVVVVPFPAGLL